jgi:hypothetical protein
MCEVPKETISLTKLVLILVAAAVILFIRKGDALKNPQFYAEDGKIFFLQQYTNGAAAVLTPYAGYLHLVPRLIAFAADAILPYSAIPAAYNYASLFITLFVIASVYSPRLAIGHKLWLALAIVLVPEDGGVVFLTITNIQWVFAIFLIVVLLKETPEKKYGSIGLQCFADLIAIVLCGLTGPFAIILAPFFIWKLVRDRKWSQCLNVVAVVSAASIQLIFLAIEHNQLSGKVESGQMDTHTLAAIFGQKLFGTLFIGDVVPYELSPYILGIVFCVTVFVLLCLAFPTNRFVRACIGLLLLITAGCIFRHRSDAWSLVPPASNCQYFYIPHVLLIWSLIGLLGRANRLKNAVLYGALALVISSSLTSDFRSEPYVDYKWKEFSKVIGEQDVRVPINPSPLVWSIDVKSRQH